MAHQIGGRSLKHLLCAAHRSDQPSSAFDIDDRVPVDALEFRFGDHGVSLSLRMRKVSAESKRQPTEPLRNDDLGTFDESRDSDKSACLSNDLDLGGRGRVAVKDVDDRRA